MSSKEESLASLEQNLSAQGYEPGRVPTVMQWNKRDLPNIVPVSDLSQKLNTRRLPEFEAVAFQGEGVFETLKTISKMVLLNIKGGLE